MKLHRAYDLENQPGNFQTQLIFNLKGKKVIGLTAWPGQTLKKLSAAKRFHIVTT